ncbi:MFS transporter [bacterium]|nr:MFS transporter [bacterium]
MKKRARNIKLLGIISMFTDVSSRMILPILPLFLVSIGATGYAIGIIEGISDVSAALLKTLFGWISDKAGKRKPFIFIGYLFSNMVKPLYAFAHSWFGAFTVRLSDRIGNGIRKAARDAFIAESCREGKSGSAFGFVKAMDKLGATIGTLLVLIVILLYKQPNFKVIFLLAGIPGILGSFVALMLRERKCVQTKKRKISFNFKQFPPQFKIFIAISFLIALANFSYMFFLLRAKDMLGWGTGELLSRNAVISTIILYLVYNLTYMASSQIAGKLVDKFSTYTIIPLGLAVFILMNLGFTLGRGMILPWILIMLYGFTQSIITVQTKTHTALLTPPELKGTAMGVYNTAEGLGNFLASPIAGIIWETRFGAPVSFAFAGVLAIAALLLFLFFQKPHYQNISTYREKE